VSKTSKILLPVVVGIMRADELGFVMSAWKHSYVDWHSGLSNGDVPRGALFDRVNRDIERILDRLHTTVYVARDAEHPVVLHGFACVEDTPESFALHYACTTKRSKRLGVCSAILEKALDRVNSKTLVYTSRSRFDKVWEDYGMQYAQLGKWLSGDET